MEKKVIRSTENIFYNSKCLFVEYIDIIKSPYLLLIHAIKEAKTIAKEPFDYSVLYNMSDDELVTWFYMRKHQNALLDLIPENLFGSIKTKDVDAFCNNQLSLIPELVDNSDFLKFGDVVYQLTRADNILVPKIYIWHPLENQTIANDINTLYNREYVKPVFGSLEEVIKKYEVPSDTTFVFSDVTNISVLNELNRLDFSSIIIPNDYAYNLDESESLIIDLDSYRKEHVFKVNYFYATL